MTTTGYLALRFLLTETAVLRNGFTPLHVESDHVIPGRVQRAMLAAAIRRGGQDDQANLVHDWVAEGKTIQFAPALPFWETAPGVGSAAVPTPAALHYRTTNDDSQGDVRHVVDLLTVREAVRRARDDTDIDPGKRLRGFITPDLRIPVEVATHTEQYLGTGRAGEPLQGVPFLTTMLDAGQVFEARWRLNADTEDALHSLAERVTRVLDAASGTLVLGTGSTRAHGGRPQITPAADTLLVPDRIHRTEEPDWPAGEERDLLLLSPTLVVDDHGEPRPDHLRSAVAALCERVLPGAVEPRDAVVESVTVECYHRMYHSAMAARWAAAAGSVVRLRSRRHVTAAEVRTLERHALGLRQVDGHGCFVLLEPVHQAAERKLEPEKSIRPAARLRLPDGTDLPAAISDPDGEVAALQSRMLAAAVAEPLRAQARQLAGKDHAENLPSPSLLGRLREVVAQPKQEPTAEEPTNGDSQRAHQDVLRRLAAVAAGNDTEAGHHKAFTTKARQDTARATIRAYANGTRHTLTDWLGRAADPDRQPDWWDSFAPRLDEAVAAVDLHRAPDNQRLSAPARQWLDDNRPWMIRLLVSTWLAEAARRRRQDDDRKEQR